MPITSVRQEPGRPGGKVVKSKFFAFGLPCFKKVPEYPLGTIEIENIANITWEKEYEMNISRLKI